MLSVPRRKADIDSVGAVLSDILERHSKNAPSALITHDPVALAILSSECAFSHMFALVTVRGKHYPPGT